MTHDLTFTVKFRQTDMIGIAYFNEVFNIFHDGYEEWAEKVIGSKRSWFDHPEWAVPLKKAEAEYNVPLMPFETYTLKIDVASVGSSSFQLKSEIRKNATVCCALTTTHVFMGRSTHKAIPIPSPVTEKLSATSDKAKD